MDLVVLNKIWTSKIPLQAEQFWLMRNGHPKTRSIKKLLLNQNDCNRQRCPCNLFYNNSMSLARDFPNYHPFSSPPKFKKSQRIST